MDIVVKVTEAPTGSIMLGGGYGSYDKFMVNGSLVMQIFLVQGLLYL